MEFRQPYNHRSLEWSACHRSWSMQVAGSDRRLRGTAPVDALASRGDARTRRQARGAGGNVSAAAHPVARVSRFRRLAHRFPVWTGARAPPFDGGGLMRARYGVVSSTCVATVLTGALLAAGTAGGSVRPAAAPGEPTLAEVRRATER